VVPPAPSRGYDIVYVIPISEVIIDVILKLQNYKADGVGLECMAAIGDALVAFAGYSVAVIEPLNELRLVLSSFDASNRAFSNRPEFQVKRSRLMQRRASGGAMRTISLPGCESDYVFTLVTSFGELRVCNRLPP
jgi:hypothetical protein